MKRIVFFTTSYPYGIGENWKRVELAELAKQFSEVVVAPLAFNGTKTAKKVPENVRVVPPLFETDSLKISLSEASWQLLKNPRAAALALREALASGSFSLARLKQSAFNLIKVWRIRESAVFKRDVLPLLSNSVLYFFWAKGYADIVSTIPKHELGPVVVRAHGFDLYHERNNGFIPLQRGILKKASKILTVSDHGLRYLTAQFPELESRIELRILGTESAGESTMSKDGVLRIVSCSFVVPVKRVALIAQALRLVEGINVDWTHVGGGEGLTNIEDLARGFPPHIRSTFLGNVPSESVPSIYKSGIFDLFVNVSESEGLPVSIMEAIAHGIPVLATDVGGTSEVVNDDVGRLVKKNISPAELADALVDYATTPTERKRELRSRCKTLYVNRLSARTLAEQLSRDLYDMASAGKIVSCNA